MRELTYNETELVGGAKNKPGLNKNGEYCWYEWVCWDIVPGRPQCDLVLRCQPAAPRPQSLPIGGSAND